MVRYFLAGSSISLLLFTGTLAVRAEAPQPEPYFPGQTSALPPDSYNPLLRYAATDHVPILKLGDRGQAVVDVQRYLKQTGLYTGAIDGIYGEISQAAVIQFQELADIRMDGIVGIETWKAMLNGAS